MPHPGDYDMDDFHQRMREANGIIAEGTALIKAIVVDPTDNDGYPTKSLATAAGRYSQRNRYVPSDDNDRNEWFHREDRQIVWNQETLRKAANERSALIGTLTSILVTAEARIASGGEHTRAWKNIAGQARNILAREDLSIMRVSVPKLAARVERKLAA